MVSELKRIYEKLKKVPEEKWITGYFNIDMVGCAIGHCNQNEIEFLNYYLADYYEMLMPEKLKKISLLKKLLSKQQHGIWVLAAINDGLIDMYDQKTARERVLAFFEDTIWLDENGDDLF